MVAGLFLAGSVNHIVTAAQGNPAEARNFDARIEHTRDLSRGPSETQITEIDRMRVGMSGLAATYDQATGATRSLRNRTGYLTGPNPGADAESLARGFVDDHHAALGLTINDISDKETTDSVHNRVTGSTHIYLRQVQGGLPVYNGQIRVSVNRDGRIVSVSNSFFPELSASFNQSQPAIDSDYAMIAAAASIGMDSAGTDASAARLMWLPIQRGEARLVWNFQLPTPDSMHHYDFTVDAATGQVWTRFDWVADGNYRVIPAPFESPNHAPVPPPVDGRTVEIDPNDPIASPFGWHDTNGIAGAEFTIHRGNNVHAYDDANNNNNPPPNQPDCGATLDCDFDFPIDFGTQQPNTYRPAAVTNLFYWNNLVHDIQYQYGFDEAGGNFQDNNYGNGGQGNDAVMAEAQDGGGNCNANMLTLPDGASPRMQMYTCSDANPSRDGDFDNAVIVHEYAHGISIRTVGGPNNTSCLNNTQQMGEGISDFLGLVYTAEASHTAEQARGMGTYLFGEPANGPGIRSAPYSTDFGVNDYLYSDMQGQSIPHGIGFVWATAAWEAYWELVNLHGFDPDLYNALGNAGNQRMMLYLQDGMQSVNCSPTFLDLRDAIIESAMNNHGGEDVCPLWDAFARRGQGLSASTPSPNSTSATNGFDVPPECGGGSGDFTLLQPLPGDAGVSNDFNSTGATPDSRVFVLASRSAGPSQVAIPGCSDVTMDLGGNPLRIGTTIADANGDATVTRTIPGGAAGNSIIIQAVDQASCTVSNSVTEEF